MVFALPGRYNDKYSEGCNFLIKNTKTSPILSIPLLIEELGLNQTFKKKPISHPPILSPQESDILKIIASQTKISLDILSEKSSNSISVCSTILLALEMKGIIRSLPGKTYELC
jgi:DNA processing protein